MARVNIFLSDELLAAADAEAALGGRNRSAFVQQALAAWIETCRKLREEERVRAEMEAASRGMDELAETLGDWDPAGLIRQFRDRRATRVGEKKKRYRGASRKGRS